VRPSSENNADDPKNKQRQKFTAQLFVRMQSNYGHKWSSLFKGDVENRMLNAAKAEWRFELRSFSEPQILAAFEIMKKHHTSFPPTLPEFRRICSNLRVRRQEAKSSQLLLTRQSQPVSIERRREHIANMRAVLSNKPATEDS